MSTAPKMSSYSRLLNLLSMEKALPAHAITCGAPAAFTRTYHRKPALARDPAASTQGSSRGPGMQASRERRACAMLMPAMLSATRTWAITPITAPMWNLGLGQAV